MAMLISRATGNFTSSSTWGVADSASGSQLTNPSATTDTTTSYVYSSAFTGTNTKVADGVVLFLRQLNTTGTFSVALSDDNGTTATREVTVNASDLPPDESWVFFEFGSTLTLDGGTDYKIGIKGSSAANVRVSRDGTAGNWARMVSTTDTAAPAAGDTMLVVGELTGAGSSNSFTVTMDNTATTDFGNGTATATAPTQTTLQNFNGLQVAQKGTLTWGTTAATAYYLKLSGNVVVWSEGVYNMGTTGTPCPRDSSMYLQFDCVADGDFGFLAMNGSTTNLQGQSRTSGKNVWYCKLNANEAVGSTFLNVDADTGWLDNDAIVVASTSRTATQSESGTLNGAAGTTALTVDGFAGAGGGLASYHSGETGIQAEVILLTRNVRISGASSAVMSYIIIGATATCDWDWIELFWIGTASTPKNGVHFLTNYASTFNMQYCCVRDSEGYGAVNFFAFASTGSITISNNSFWNCALGVTFGEKTDLGTLTISGNVMISTGLRFGRGTFDNNIVVGAVNGFYWAPSVAQSTPDSFSGNVAHSCSSNGFRLDASSTFSMTASNLTLWRNNTNGILFNGSNQQLTINNGTLFGNGTNINSSNNIGGIALTLNNVNLNGDTSFSTATGLNLSPGTSGANGWRVWINDCNFSTVSGFYTAHTQDISIGSGTGVEIYASNTILAAATEVASPSSLNLGFVKSSKHDQTEGAFKSWFRGGRVERDTTIFNTAAPSERLTPTSASIKLSSGSRLVAIDDGSTVTINVYVRKSASGDGAAYNGNQPRLIVKANPACGISSDTVLDTMTFGTGSWEQLTGTTAAVNADGALEFYVDCDGTAGWVNVDDWTVS